MRLKLRFQKRLRFLVEESFDEEAIAQDADGALLVTAEYPDEDWLCGFLLSFGDEVEVLEPEEMREKIAKKAEKIVFAISNLTDWCQVSLDRMGLNNRGRFV